jgi:hypothetical protein
LPELKVLHLAIALAIRRLEEESSFP